MWSFLSRNQSIGQLLLRIGVGCLILYAYGWEKLAGGSKEWAKLGSAMELFHIEKFHAFWGFLGTMAETLGMLLFVIGFAFRPACLYITIHFFVAAAARYHGLKGFGSGSGLDAAGFPLILAIVFLSMAIIGPGKYSVDRQ
jgi:putative oxidoreductase